MSTLEKTKKNILLGEPRGLDEEVVKKNSQEEACKIALKTYKENVNCKNLKKFYGCFENFTTQINDDIATFVQECDSLKNRLKKEGTPLEFFNPRTYAQYSEAEAEAKKENKPAKIDIKSDWGRSIFVYVTLQILIQYFGGDITRGYLNLNNLFPDLAKVVELNTLYNLTNNEWLPNVNYTGDTIKWNTTNKSRDSLEKIKELVRPVCDYFNKLLHSINNPSVNTELNKVLQDPKYNDCALTCWGKTTPRGSKKSKLKGVTRSILATTRPKTGRLGKEIPARPGTARPSRRRPTTARPTTARLGKARPGTAMLGKAKARPTTARRRSGVKGGTRKRRSR